MIYGQWNYPKGFKRRKNASLISINDHLENATGIIIQDITDEILGFQIITACEDARFKLKK
jgi:hypothetical protein